VVIITPLPRFIPRESTAVSIGFEAGWASALETRGNILCLCRDRNLVVQPVVRHIILSEILHLFGTVHLPAEKPCLECGVVGDVMLCDIYIYIYIYIYIHTHTHTHTQTDKRL
jgi:hypothetical protein